MIDAKIAKLAEAVGDLQMALLEIGLDPALAVVVNRETGMAIAGAKRSAVFAFEPADYARDPGAEQEWPLGRYCGHVCAVPIFARSGVK